MRENKINLRHFIQNAFTYYRSANKSGTPPQIQHNKSIMSKFGFYVARLDKRNFRVLGKRNHLFD